MLTEEQRREELEGKGFSEIKKLYRKHVPQPDGISFRPPQSRMIDTILDIEYADEEEGT